MYLVYVPASVGWAFRLLKLLTMINYALGNVLVHLWHMEKHFWARGLGYILYFN